MSGRGGKAIVAITALVSSVYFGITFWRPIVEQLAKDGNLREDIKFDQAEIEEQPKSWSDLRQKFDAVIDPSKLSETDQKSLEDLKHRLTRNNPNNNNDGDVSK
ncbi:hypothetical protein G210_5098 [Candida maltosa Xu316]|uniref:Uncharacterized protein n=1 Tax=Candida maltosa (strain Xu316) TaxID=1245528 RepID=M3JCL5_CANMX|nr:hypothetical protein G210_5098 [Candida maltosa Xu316]